MDNQYTKHVKFALIQDQTHSNNQEKYKYSNKPSSIRLESHYNRFTQIDQEMVMKIYKGSFERVIAPKPKRATYQPLQQNLFFPKTNTSNIDICSRVFDKQFKQFEINHKFWQDYGSNTQESNNKMEQNSIQSQFGYSNNFGKSMSSSRNQLIFSSCKEQNNTLHQLLSKQEKFESSLLQIDSNYQKMCSEDLSDEMKSVGGNGSSSVGKTQIIETSSSPSLPKYQSLNKKRVLPKQKISFSELQTEDQLGEKMGKSFLNYHEKLQENQNHKKQKIFQNVEVNSPNVSDPIKPLVRRQTYIDSPSSEVYLSSCGSNQQLFPSKKQRKLVCKETKLKQKRSKYFERIINKEQTSPQIQSENKSNYIQSRDLTINDTKIEIYETPLNQIYCSSHWLFGKESETSLDDKQQKAVNLLERIIQMKEINTRSTDAEVLETLNICSFILQTSQIHKEFERLFYSSFQYSASDLTQAQSKRSAFFDDLDVLLLEQTGKQEETNALSKQKTEEESKLVSMKNELPRKLVDKKVSKQKNQLRKSDNFISISYQQTQPTSFHEIEEEIDLQKSNSNSLYFTEEIMLQQHQKNNFSYQSITLEQSPSNEVELIYLGDSDQSNVNFSRNDKLNQRCESKLKKNSKTNQELNRRNSEYASLHKQSVSSTSITAQQNLTIKQLNELSDKNCKLSQKESLPEPNDYPIKNQDALNTEPLHQQKENIFSNQEHSFDRFQSRTIISSKNKRSSTFKRISQKLTEKTNNINKVCNNPTENANSLSISSEQKGQEKRHLNSFSKGNPEEQKEQEEVLKSNLQFSQVIEGQSNYKITTNCASVIKNLFIPELQIIDTSTEDEFNFNYIKLAKHHSLSAVSSGKNQKDMSPFDNDDLKGRAKQEKKDYGKFHNFNKLYMHNVMKMFSEQNLYKLRIPSFIVEEISKVILKIKLLAKRQNNQNRDSQYYYFSNSHYHILFHKISQQSMKSMSDVCEFKHFYNCCFQINIQANTSQVLSVIYTNLIKRYCYIVYTLSINKSYQQSINAKEKTPRQEYILKATEGIQNLQKGFLVKRF